MSHLFLVNMYLHMHGEVSERIAMGQSAYHCLCKEPLPEKPLCGDSGGEDDDC